MTLEDLIARFRLNTDDAAQPYLSSDDEIVAWLNEAEGEACLRAKLLHEADDPAYCKIPVKAGQRRYQLHPGVLEIEFAYLVVSATETRELGRITRQEATRLEPAWRDLTDTPTAIVAYDDSRLELNRTPAADATIRIECYRLPLRPLKMDTPTAEPEIHRAHHLYLLDWVEVCCYRRPDSQVFDQNRATAAETRFTKQFGVRPDAAQRKDAQADRPQVNRAYWP